MPNNPTNVRRPKTTHNHHDKSKALQQLGAAAKETLETAVHNRQQQRRPEPSRSFRGGRRRTSGRRLVTDKERITAMTEAGIAAVERWAGTGTLPAQQKEVLVHMGAALNAAIYSAETMEETLNYLHLVLRAAYFYGVSQPQRLPAHESGNGKVEAQEVPLSD